MIPDRDETDPGRSGGWRGAALGYLPESASQTAGPYVHIGCVPSFAGLEGMYRGQDLGTGPIAGEGAKGERIVLTGRVLDGAGTPVRDALLEAWQADAAGRFAGQKDADPDVRGWGRCPTDPEGRWRFETVMPGSVPWPDGRMQAPHVALWIAARGINVGLYTRLYFDGHEGNEADPLLGRIEQTSRLPTLMARRDGDAWHFDIHLQGNRETVFFDA